MDKNDFGGLVMLGAVAYGLSKLFSPQTLSSSSISAVVGLPGLTTGLRVPMKTLPQAADKFPTVKLVVPTPAAGRGADIAVSVSWKIHAGKLAVGPGPYNTPYRSLYLVVHFGDRGRGATHPYALPFIPTPGQDLTMNVAYSPLPDVNLGWYHLGVELYNEADQLVMGYGALVQLTTG